MKKESPNKFFLFIFQIMLLTILLFGLISILILIIFLIPTTVENYLFKIITGSIVIILIGCIMYICEFTHGSKAKFKEIKNESITYRR